MANCESVERSYAVRFPRCEKTWVDVYNLTGVEAV